MCRRFFFPHSSQLSIYVLRKTVKFSYFWLLDAFTNSLKASLNSTRCDVHFFRPRYGPIETRTKKLARQIIFFIIPRVLLFFPHLFLCIIATVQVSQRARSTEKASKSLYGIRRKTFYKVLRGQRYRFLLYADPFPSLSINLRLYFSFENNDKALIAESDNCNSLPDISQFIYNNTRIKVVEQKTTRYFPTLSTSLKRLFL